MFYEKSVSYFKILENMQKTWHRNTNGVAALQRANEKTEALIKFKFKKSSNSSNSSFH
jgi:hypothetical protein